MVTFLPISVFNLECTTQLFLFQREWTDDVRVLGKIIELELCVYVLSARGMSSKYCMHCTVICMYVTVGISDCYLTVCGAPLNGFNILE
jgi:hypothetical protein